MNRYIAFEGIDGVGKTSCAHRVASLLRSRQQRPVVEVREPTVSVPDMKGRSRWSRALWYIADRSDLIEQTVLPALEAGSIVISDRSVYSTVAYQGGGGGLGVHAVQAVCRLVCAPVWPGRVFLLECPLDETSKRDTDPEGRPGGQTLASVADAYRQAAGEDPVHVVTVDASLSLDEVVEHCYQTAAEYLNVPQPDTA